MANRLFLELLFVAAILLVILLINNIFLYKQKLTDFISLMLVSGIAMCVFEIVWTVFEGNANLRIPIFIMVWCYCTSLIIFAAFLNLYLLDRLGIRLKKKWLLTAYGLPIAATALLCATTMHTKIIFWVTEGGKVQLMPFFDDTFHALVYFYFFSPLLVALFFLTIGKQKRPSGGEIPISMFIFGAMAPILYWFQVAFFGGENGVFETSSLPVSLALVYLVTNVSTNIVLKTRAKVEAVETDLRIAAKIQTDALPSAAPEFAEHLELILRGSMNTAKEVGGDFYDYFPLDENRICFLIADVSGKGTPAALFMMTAKTMIKDYALMRENTSDIFNAVNARLCENNEAGMFATAWIGILDTRTMKLQYTNAGHNYPILQPKNKPCIYLKKVHGLFLAGLEFTRYKQDEIQLEPGDRLLLYTDGITEAHNTKNELYGEERLIETMESSKELSTEDTLENILKDVNDFATGMPQFDDMTMIVLSIKEPLIN
ncbi:MAG TPA: serine/threonine-protein phosphatase [Lachnospiraceae bacterium]|nr:serine/threonine-protein phosphatase [Lachnospiraceae bacterium]